MLFRSVSQSRYNNAKEISKQAADLYDKFVGFLNDFEDIVIVSPTTLYSSLKVIENLWQDNRQSENAKEISKQAADLYDKFVGFLNDFEDIGKSIDKSKESYDKAINKLSSGRGNLISRSQKFLELGVKPTKEISSKYIKDEETITHYRLFMGLFSTFCTSLFFGTRNAMDRSC